MDTIELHGLTFRVEVEPDPDMGAPWEHEDFHGPVTGWEQRGHYRGGKRGGELILVKHGGGFYSFYDFAAACKIALDDSWAARDAEPGMTKRQVAALAAREDYERLKAWCDDRWHYVGVVVTLLDAEGNPLEDYADSCWGIESDADGYINTVATDLALDIGALVNWEPVIEVPARTIELRRAA